MAGSPFSSFVDNFRDFYALPGFRNLCIGLDTTVYSVHQVMVCNCKQQCSRLAASARVDSSCNSSLGDIKKAHFPSFSCHVVFIIRLLQRSSLIHICRVVLLSIISCLDILSPSHIGSLQMLVPLPIVGIFHCEWKVSFMLELFRKDHNTLVQIANKSINNASTA